MANISSFRAWIELFIEKLNTAAKQRQAREYCGNPRCPGLPGTSSVWDHDDHQPTHQPLGRESSACCWSSLYTWCITAARATATPSDE
jgi:hypothetical protein